MLKLSIIIPCFNCTGTLEDAVNSIYYQDLQMPFEVVMVDDGSTDQTYQLMDKLSSKHPHISLVRHRTNQGGGCARNSAVDHSSGDIIFPLDSDDILGPNALRNLTDFWLEKQSDGVGISTSIKFKKNDLENIAYVNHFEGPGNKVRFESLFEGAKCSLYSTFLITRKAFCKIGGYPTHHGFDTQGMAFRFLGNGLTAYTCPDTLYYHRIHYHESYYLREKHAGRINQNWFKILVEFLYLFKDEIKIKILQNDLFAKPGKSGPKNLIGEIASVQEPFVENYQDLIKLGRDNVAKQHQEVEDMFWQYWLGDYYASKGQYNDALIRYNKALNLGFNFRTIYYEMLKIAQQISGSKKDTGDLLVDLIHYSESDPIYKMARFTPVFQFIKHEIKNKPVIDFFHRKLRNYLNRLKYFCRRNK